METIVTHLVRRHEIFEVSCFYRPFGGVPIARRHCLEKHGSIDNLDVPSYTNVVDCCRFFIAEQGLLYV